MNRYYLVCLMSLALMACHTTKQKAIYPKVKVIKPVQMIGVLKKHYIGTTKPVLQVTLRARVEGFLEKRLFKEGAFVKKDELLYTIEKAPYEAQLLTAKGNLEKAKADLAFQTIQLKRFEALVAHQNVSKSQYDEQLTKHLSAEGQLDSAQGNYDQALLNLNYTNVYSPMNGLTGKTMVDVGNLVSGSNKTELLKIVQLDPLRVEFNPSVADVKTFMKYKDNQPFSAEVYVHKSGPKSFHGIVDFYNNDADENTSTLLLRTTIMNKNYSLKPDSYVKVDVILDPKHRYQLIPINKVNDVQGLKQVLVVDANHHLIWRKVDVSDIKNDLVVVDAGLNKGDLIVMEDLINFTEGTQVEPLFIHLKKPIL